MDNTTNNGDAPFRITLPAQSLTLFHEKGATTDGRAYDLWRGELDDVPPNKFGVTVAQFTDRDVSDAVADAMVALTEQKGVSKNEKNTEYMYLGVVEMNCEFTAVRVVTRKDGSQFLAARVKPLSVKRAANAAAAKFAAGYAAK